MTGRWTRRRFLVVGGAAVGLGALVLTRHDERYAASGLVAAMPDPERTARFGSRATAVVSDPSDVIAVRLAPSGAGARWVDRAEPAAVRSRLREAIAADFAAGRTVEVDGWVVSATEADAAVLVHRATG